MIFKLTKLALSSLIFVALSSQRIQAFTITEGPLPESNINGDLILDPFVFSFTGLPEVATTETELFLRLDWIDLDLDATSEFLTASIQNSAGTFDLGQFPKTITSAGPPAEQANVDGFGELSVLLSDIGNFSEGNLTVTFNPENEVNAILPGNPAGFICNSSNCGGSATLTLSYAEAAEPVPEPQTLTILGIGITLGFGTFIKRKQRKLTA